MDWGLGSSMGPGACNCMEPHLGSAELGACHSKEPGRCSNGEFWLGDGARGVQEHRHRQNYEQQTPSSALLTKHGFMLLLSRALHHHMPWLYTA